MQLCSFNLTDWGKYTFVFSHSGNGVNSIDVIECDNFMSIMFVHENKQFIDIVSSYM